MLRPATFALCCLALAGGLSAAEQKSKFNEKVNVGDKPPAFQNLEGVDGKPHSLSDYKDAEVLVVAFTGNNCPVAQAYQERFRNLVRDYRGKKVQFIAINANAGEADRLDEMKEHAAARNFSFDYLADPQQKVARAYGAAATPHLFVLDKERRIAYMGAFDDSMNPAKVEHHYVRDAVEALLKGEDPEIAESKQFGCPILYN